ATLGCRHAAEIATRMAAHLHSCTVRGVDALVIVSTRSDGVLLGLGAAEGRARAGPVLLTAPATH
ncbi:MAG: hypothetical protein ACRDRL_02250, partial [Sciscionella sp.]